MKKLLSFMFVILGITMVMLSGCKKNNNIIRLNEVTHTIFYAPLYVAINKGFFKEYNIEIQLSNGGGADKSMSALVSGGADVGLMGPEACIYVASQGKKNMPKVFAQLTNCDGSFIVSRNKIDNFTWDMLNNKEILGGRKGGMPAMSLEYALSKNGLINGENININYDVEFNLMAAAFQSGVGDFVTCFEPTASQIVANKKGHIVASVGKEVGEVPFTTFMANENYLRKNKTRISNFIKAVLKGKNFVLNNSEEEVANVLLKSFNGSSKESIVASLKSYKAINAWVENPIMKESSFNRLQDVMRKAGEIRNNVDYNLIVDNSYANYAMQK